MSLRIPGRQVQNKLPTLRFWFVEIRVTLGERTKQLPLATFEVQTKRSVERMTGFVTEYAHTLGVTAAFHFQHLLPFQLHQSWMREIKRNRNPRHSIGRKPFFREPHVWL